MSTYEIIFRDTLKFHYAFMSNANVKAKDTENWLKSLEFEYSFCTENGLRIAEFGEPSIIRAFGSIEDYIEVSVVARIKRTVDAENFGKAYEYAQKISGTSKIKLIAAHGETIIPERVCTDIAIEKKEEKEEEKTMENKNLNTENIYPDKRLYIRKDDPAFDSIGYVHMNGIEYRMMPKISKIVFNPPATIVFWADGCKTVVKTSEKAEFDPYYGVTCAIAKRLYKNNSAFKEVLVKKSNFSELMEGNKTMKSLESKPIEDTIEDVIDEKNSDDSEVAQYLIDRKLVKYVETNRKHGMSDRRIATGIGLTSIMELRKEYSGAVKRMRDYNVKKARTMKSEGLSNYEIAKSCEVSERTVRAWLAKE